MVKSMTGYGRAQELVGDKDITVEIKTVNHKGFEFYARTSRGCSFLEDKLKKLVNESVSRGKVDLFLTVASVGDDSCVVELNKPLAASYIAALRQLSEDYSLKDDISVMSVARFPDLFTVKKAEEDEDALWEAVKSVTEKALDSLVSMRITEGAKLLADVDSRLDTVLGFVSVVEEHQPETLAKYKERLRERIEELIGDAKVDEQRLLTECAVFADRIAVDEETVRLRTHVEHFRKIISSGEPVGRKLDFIVQEMNREANTIGSKAQNTEIAHTVVDIKAEIEKIREQIQNIE